MRHFGKLLRNVACTGVAASALIPVLAFAQAGPETLDQPVEASPSESAEADNDIVVTGTLVRGVSPTGASPIAVNEAAIEATGATTVAQLLQTIPQLGTFGTLQQPLAVSQEVSVNRPNLRSLPGFNNTGGSTTLVLMDGHRLVGMGTATTTPDPDVIPPGVLQRVEIVPDGGSAIYGSDAVAGVLNFITIKRFDGVKVDASYGFADDYYRWDANVTAGKDWGSGSLFVSYNYAKSDILLGRDRDYIREFPQDIASDPAPPAAPNIIGATSLQCSPGNVQDANPATGAQVFALPGRVRGTANQCDASDFATIFPESSRHSVFAGLTQELTDAITFELRGFYTGRKTRVVNGPFRFTQLVTPINVGVPSAISPYAVGPAFSGQLPFVQFVSGRFGRDDASQANISLDTWGVTPTVTVDLGNNFQLRVLASYGESLSKFSSSAINNAALLNAIQTGTASFAPPFAVTGGIFNPYDPSSAAAGVLDAITNYRNFGRTKQYFHNERVILDGDLFELPGGAVKFAAGLEYMHETFDAQNGVSVPGFENIGFAGAGIIPAHNPIPRYKLSRNVKSAFGEVVVPLFKTDGGMSLTVSAAGRYDDYSDFGSTFNPRFGATFKPVEWVSIFGAWGKSFNAPSLADDESTAASTVFVLGGSAASFFRPPAELVSAGAYPAYDGRQIVAVRGNAPNIQPQRATTWSVGIDVQPPIVPGLNAGATYFNIAFDNQIGLAPFESPVLLYQNFSNLITTGPTAAVDALVGAAIANADIINVTGGTANPPPGSVYAFFDARKRNLGRVKVDGIDFRLNYQRPTGFGSVFTTVNGTYTLNLERSNTATSPFFETIDTDNSRLKLRASLGATVGPVLGQVTWNHLQGYDLAFPAGFTGTALDGRVYTAQTHVDSFNTFDLFFKFDVPGDDWAEDLSLTLNVNNLFDEAPPEFRGGNQVAGQLGIANGQTLGRLVQFGISKKF